MIPVDSIIIPSEYVELCHGWHGGLRCKMYAVCSTGNLTIGNRRPLGTETKEEWYYSIWCDLLGDVDSAVSMVVANREDEEAWSDLDGLMAFEAYCERMVDKLAESYGLE